MSAPRAELEPQENSAPENKGVSKTGLMTLFWKIEANKPEFWHRLEKAEANHGKVTRVKPLYKDEEQLRALFCNADAIEEGKKCPSVLALAIAVRDRFFTREMSKIIKADQAKQVVLLGSGYDTRAVRKRKFTQAKGVQFFEVDQAEVLAKKAEIYRQAKIDPNAVYVGMDYLKEDLIARLKAEGLDFSKPTHFIWEGNIFYLTKAQVEHTLELIKSAFTGPLYLSCDYMDPKVSQVSQVQTLQKTLAASNASMQKEIGDFHQEIITKLGFTLVTDRACSEMTKEYGVGDDPYESQKDYHLCTFRK